MIEKIFDVSVCVCVCILDMYTFQLGLILVKTYLELLREDLMLVVFMAFSHLRTNFYVKLS